MIGEERYQAVLFVIPVVSEKWRVTALHRQYPGQQQWKVFDGIDPVDICRFDPFQHALV